MLSTLRKTSPVRLALYSLVALTLFHFWYATHLGLIEDEAYYWLWSKHFALSYRDKGPLVAWVIALGTQIFGDTVFGIRFFAVLLSSWTAWMLFSFARRLYDDSVGLWVLLVALIMPIFAVGSIIMTIDSLSVPLWLLAAIIFWRILQTNKALDWFWLGLVIGLGFLAKFTNGVQCACIGLLLLWSKEHRRLLLSWKPFVGALAFFASITPLIWWNIQTGWIHAIALKSRGGVKSGFGIHPAQFLRFLGEQSGVVSPLLFIGLVIAAVALLLRRNSDLRTRFLLSQSVPLFALFMFFSINKAGQPNWTAPALMTGIIFTVAYWRELVALKPSWRGGVVAALAVAGLMTLSLYILEFLPIPPKWDLMGRARGWQDFGRHVQDLREKNHPTVLIGDHYAVASLMTFYLPDRPVTYLQPEPYASSQFSLWPTYEVPPATRALLIARGPNKIKESLRRQFSNIQLIDHFWTQENGRPMNEFYAYLCTP